MTPRKVTVTTGVVAQVLEMPLGTFEALVRPGDKAGAVVSA